MCSTTKVSLVEDILIKRVLLILIKGYSLRWSLVWHINLSWKRRMEKIHISISLSKEGGGEA